MKLYHVSKQILGEGTKQAKEKAHNLAMAAYHLASRNHATTALIALLLIETALDSLGKDTMVEQYGHALLIVKFHLGENHPLTMIMHEKMAQWLCQMNSAPGE